MHVDVQVCDCIHMHTAVNCVAYCNYHSCVCMHSRVMCSVMLVCMYYVLCIFVIYFICIPKKKTGCLVPYRLKISY